MNTQDFVKILNNGGIGVLPTDTIYGLVTSALNQKSVEKVYQIRKRSPDKPFIILIYSINDLKLFEITVNELTMNYLTRIWPNPVSVILPVTSNDFAYLHRGTNTLAFRIPNNHDLLEILREAGPLIAPSVNPEGLPPAKTIKEAKKYFGDQVDFYVDQGKLDTPPSTLIKIDAGKVQILRQGEFVVK